jgi:hypothetical protein
MIDRKKSGCLAVMIIFLGLYGLVAVGFQKALLFRGHRGHHRGGPVWIEGAPAVWQGVSMLSLAGGILAYDILVLAGKRRAANWVGVTALLLFLGTQTTSWWLWRDVKEHQREERREKLENSPEVKELRKQEEQLRKRAEEIRGKRPGKE